jgi:hypothetical protein
MPFNAEQLAYGGRAAINFFLKNDPVDQINIAHPLFNKLVASKKEYVGGKQYVVEQLREANDSNFQGYFGDSQVTYNRKRTLNQAQFAYGSFFDGFGLNEDELIQNGITMTSDRSATPSASEKVNLTNLVEENMETLRLGFANGMDLMFHRDGTQSSLEIAGLDHLVAVVPGTGTIGGIDASAKSYWENQVSLNITIANLVGQMEDMWRECIRYGGAAPDFILAGETAIDSYRSAANSVIDRQLDMGKGRGAAQFDAGIGEGTRTGLFFKGVEIIWDPLFQVLETADGPAQEWDSRMYFLNTKTIKLRPIKNHWMVPRKPPSVYDRFVQYWATTAKCALTINKRRANALLTVTGA